MTDIVVTKEKIALQQEINHVIAERNARLAAEVIGLHEGQDSIEEYARTQLGLIKPDETFFLVVQ